mmetsp:Transcript_13998/g.39865  ORF Transcript_13998/g.39865 Transcript_13998/m.39865 type:complete len:201 (-) Transcript_13998:1755-2357(-)
MMDGGIQDSVAHRLGDDEFGRCGGWQAQPISDILQGHAGVADVELAQSRLDDLMRQTRDERVRAIGLELRCILRHHGREGLEITFADRLCDVKVRGQLNLHALGEEDVAFRDFAHQELDDDQQPLHFDAEAQACVVGRLAHGLREAGVGLGIFQPQRVDSAAVVQVPTKLIVGCRIWERGVRKHLVGLFDLVMQQVIPQH